ncbi:hypothetical protein B9T12_06010 [Wohlfahrtiimonas chitiniclastica]|uniref:YiiX/YebB-like N1pC/P60 family cysteine hydrolase n=1 Tax=Wohlfahrtiimonas chitiniclastica TaxID=400946 RepID=UPI000B99D41C|nr:YiiX/YebB-like N1pC/P60 family cysteine hydrolase [Wohlfahrtiimonas chitiniclastica]OYQ78399.1 hypothetical protein B9T12_06010 [Wohlfahrtiimonas chitiniclastica]
MIIASWIKISVVSLTALFLCPSVSAKTLALGDIVLRTGNNVDSLIIQKLSGGRFSHIGIITDLNPVMVTHSTTDDDPKHLNQVITTPLPDFLAAHMAKDYVIVRPAFLSESERAQLSHHIKKQLGNPYVLKARTEENLYCTTLIEQPLMSLKPELKLTWQSIDVGPFQGQYLFPDAFLQLPNMMIVDEFSEERENSVQ